MTVEVPLQITGVDLRTHEAQALVNDHLSDYAFAVVSGITTMTVFSDGDVVADTLRAVRCARHHGITVLRVYEDRVNYAEIARRVGVSSEAARKWARDTTFPEPRTGSDNDRGTAHRWDWAEVLHWLNAHKALDLDEELPTEQQVRAIDAAIAGVRDYTSAEWHRVLAMPAAKRVATVFHTEMLFAPLAVTTAGWERVDPTPEADDKAAAREPVFYA